MMTWRPTITALLLMSGLLVGTVAANQPASGHAAAGVEPDVDHPAQATPTDQTSVVEPGAEMQRLATGFRFTEGPSAMADGGLYFTDVFDPQDPEFDGEMYHWSPGEGATLYRDHTRRTNGTGWHPDGGLVTCEWFGRQLAYDDLAGNVETLFDSYEGERLNGPNDVWVAPGLGLYFTDPLFGQPPGEIEMESQHIYFVPAGGDELVRVTDPLLQPNGLVGTPDLKWLYVTESGGVTYRYAIEPDGLLTDKSYFAPRSGDGMTLDSRGNVYIADDYDVWVYDASGEMLETIRPPEPPSNVTFGGVDGRTLFITAYTSVYSQAMAVTGAYLPPGLATPVPPDETAQPSTPEPTPEPTDVVPPGAKVERLATGFTFTEGPVVDSNGDVYFTDVPQSVIYRYRPGDELTTYRTQTGRGNGLYFDSEWRMTVCEGGGKRVALDDRSGSITTLADEFGGRPFNAPNDLWIAPGGGVYFTDPLFVAAGPSNQGVSRAYYVPPGGGEPVAVLDDLNLPNGLIGTPDGATLYVADYAVGGKVWRYDIEPDGTLSGKTEFVSRSGDGMTLDVRGNVYVVSGSRVRIYASDGTELDTIEVPETPSNVTFGGPDGRTLYITATTSLYEIELNVRGAYAPDLPATPTPTAGPSVTATATQSPEPPEPTMTHTPEPTPGEWTVFCPIAVRGIIE